MSEHKKPENESQQQQHQNEAVEPPKKTAHATRRTPITQTQLDQYKAVQSLTKAFEVTLEKCPALESVSCAMTWKPSPYNDPEHASGTLSWVDSEGQIDSKDIRKTFAITRAISSTLGLLNLQFETLIFLINNLNEVTEIKGKELAQLETQINNAEAYYAQLQEAVRDATNKLNPGGEQQPEADGEADSAGQPED